MPTYKAPDRDSEFILNEVINIYDYSALPGFSDATPDLVSAKLTEGAKFVEEVTQPLNQVGDETGCSRNDDGSVSTPTGFKDAYEQLIETGWLMKNALSNADNAGAASVPYLYVMGLVSLGYMWTRIANAALLALASGTNEADFYTNKLQTARYF